MDAPPLPLSATAPPERPAGLPLSGVPARRRLLDRVFSPLVMVVYAVTLGLGLGLGSAYEALRGPFPFGSVEIGPWVAWPGVGSGKADPYARAIVAKRSDVPLALGEGLALTATRDSAGRTLTAACTYRVGTVMPQTRFWTLSVLDGEDRPIDTGMKRSGYTSAEILRDADGSFAVTLSRTLQPGNWIQLPPAGDFRIALRLYDMPGIGGALKLGAESLPAIERQECTP